MNMRVVVCAGAALLLAACGSDEPAQNTAAAAPAKLAAGQYEVQMTVTSFRSTDGKTPLVKAKQGDVITGSGCVGADGTPAPELFAAKGDVCTVQNPYIRNGRMNLTLDCTRKGAPGRIMEEVNGSFTADGLTGTASTTSFIDGPGDYELKADVKGRRVGECTAAAPKAA
ncbi:DUF3617 domain-containing protein [Sphingomonas sp. BN140010]|uniref:DUF3617 domain-containing protein n=1 Tax=Sphingomonas arvum TaxID=2992113 RepID=A0ABT3JG94_9SPHN|nr:DUF3617 domain-containing protein [Sphingomonas sp. BN140010]MCW3798016.1 DUF3617 domain-containing protein [Sphingomonas sp. BN140010]